MKFGAPAWRARRTSATVIGIVALAAIAFAPCPARAEATEADSTTDVTCASATQAVPTTWYFPSTPPLGLVWLQHGFVEGKKVWSAFGPELAGSGYLVVATTLSTLNIFGCTVEHLIDNRGFLDNIADVFAHKDDPRGALATSFATAAEKAGRPVAPLPDNMVFVGHSAGSEAVEYVAERLHSSYPAAFTQLRGVVSEDGVKSFLGSNTDDALAGLAGTTLPIYATASPHLLCNFFQRGTKAIERYFPDRTFHGVKITTGAHGDALGPSSPGYENLVCGRPKADNVAAVWGLTRGWIADMIAGTTTPDFYPGGSYYTDLLTAGTITTLP
ncbi:hypothetical protein A9X03_14110 [Mycobacterium sp. E1715]|uniref:hypothetical protein n=1 Tax=unclassified Mycobacterium TaxID=2642494 RepID=UPI0007FD08C4|nr:MULTISPECIES: hypothetical protein [unclassified Mycobacterium]OBG64355.1 hypothetical protein A5703_17845 [Mycobacterium sp. E188]OBG79008.1 hypothetical protein A5701_14725 [Mycobacterium sp. E3305]OBG85664.1 hypothetical protein A9X05_16440 [Mycobacterium sp. E3298]OBH23974.1 hypothetical protein A9X03_14110 [Mycobacterium sp. E1715]OBH36110.1 hypothetical protein A5691_05120 [Mycobacterium sp. E183]